MSDSDRDLTELAAKAIGEEVEWLPSQKVFYRKSCDWPQEKGFFAPLHNDGEALGLVMKLDMTVNCNRDELTVIVQTRRPKLLKAVRSNNCDADVRRTIVEVAAMNGRLIK
ncbi:MULTISPECIES: hypothetical protein [Pseudomonas]|uniref:Uncharacterized protein n=1 Tax=Pseudomonas carnis TaxID=2487355 RepID=A0ABT5RNP5_9PSED|nr:MULTISPECIES: hypothetical protein [Pseudomonas]MDD1947611.1 hypothetical protein [Pseudomonas carnis]